MTDEIVLDAPGPNRVLGASVKGVSDGYDSTVTLPREPDTIHHDVPLLRWARFPPEPLLPSVFNFFSGRPPKSLLLRRRTEFPLSHNAILRAPLPLRLQEPRSRSLFGREPSLTVNERQLFGR